jgi:DHA1 family multidrug resistance protein-like MFS transporter
MLWGPLSEVQGRRVPLFLGYTLFTIFQVPVAVAQNLETIFIFRFLGGVCGAAPLAVVAGALADVWDPVDRGVAVS